MTMADLHLHSIIVTITFEAQCTDGTCLPIKGHTHLDNSLDHQEPSTALHNNAFRNYYIYLKKFSVQHHIEPASTTYISTWTLMTSFFFY